MYEIDDANEVKYMSVQIGSKERRGDVY